MQDIKMEVMRKVIDIMPEKVTARYDIYDISETRYTGIIAM